MAAPPQPPANPYGASSGGATIFGAAGNFTIRPGGEMRVGRDPAQCGVFLQEPRISGVHASLKFEGGQLWVKDESSNNGVYVDGARIAPAAWTPVGPGGQLRFGPVDFGVRFDA
jgi:pSer/pThr/pTyr-binding forkhead associated (FHA) protein